jgi:hypothetical protein
VSAPITEARLAEIEAMKARIREAPDAVDALIDEMVRLLGERDEARATLAAHARHTDAAVDGVRAMLPEALEIARREGAEAMRAALIARFKGRVEYLRPWAAEDAEDGCHTGAWTEALNAVQFTQEMALPLDAPGGAS